MLYLGPSLSGMVNDGQLSLWRLVFVLLGIFATLSKVVGFSAKSVSSSGSWNVYSFNYPVVIIIINVFCQMLNVSVSSAHQKVFAITHTFGIMQFDKTLQKFFNCSFRGSTSLLTRIIKPSSHRAFTCTKSIAEIL